MRDAAGQLPYRLHLLCLAEMFFQRAPVGDIDTEGKKPSDLSVGLYVRQKDEFNIARAAIRIR